MAATSLTVQSILDSGFPSSLASTLGIAVPPGPTLPAASWPAALKVASSVAGDAAALHLAGIVQALGTPAQIAGWAIDSKYSSLGGPGGFLGASQTATTICPDGVGYFHHYTGGSIYFNPATGAHEVHGAIRDKWSALGWERAFGYPTTDETAAFDGVGRYNHFQSGAIYWSPSTGAFAIHGDIGFKYLSIGAEKSVLGYPLSDETGTADGVGRFNRFQGGSIYWKPSTNAHYVAGPINAYWTANGSEKNASLGYPISDELAPSIAIDYTLAGIVTGPINVTIPLGVKGETRVAPAGGAGSIRPTAAMLAARDVHTAALVTGGAVAMHAGPLEPASTIAAHAVTTGPGPALPKTDDRYGDFENGVVFFRYGTAAAMVLSPYASLTMSAQDVINGMMPSVNALLQSLSGIPFAAPVTTFAGVTDYSFDGMMVHNRRHRLNVSLTAAQAQIFGLQSKLVVTLELQVEVAYDPIRSQIVGSFVAYHVVNVAMVGLPTSFFFDQSVALHGALDPKLWGPVNLHAIPSQVQGVTAPVLSVKVALDGSVHSYLETPDAKGKEGKEKDSKEGKETKEKDGKESKDTKEGKEGKEKEKLTKEKDAMEKLGAAELAHADFIAPRPMAEIAPAAETRAPIGRPFIRPEERPVVGARIIADGEERA